jgi:hypothetical protein
MPWDRAKYPADWEEVRERILARAGGRCECEGECGLHCTHPGPRRCEETDRSPAKWARGRVVLTVAHLNHDTQDSRESNLKAMCNRCHLRYDVNHHRRNAAATRRRKQRERGQGFLIDVDGNCIDD